MLKIFAGMAAMAKFIHSQTSQTMKTKKNRVSEKGSAYRTIASMRTWAMDDIPGEKYLMKGSASLSDVELLSIIIGTGIPGENSMDIARALLMRFNNNLSELAKVMIPDLQKTRGIGLNKALKISSAFSLGRRRNECEALERVNITSSHDAFDILGPIVRDIPYEEFWILILNKSNKLIKKERISEGGVSGTIVDPKKLFHFCLENLASSVILCHNHPSGNPVPSKADEELTKKITDAGKLLDIVVLDHIIIAGDRYYSFAEEGAI